MIAREQLLQQRRAAEPHPTAMIERPGPVLRWFFGRFFREIAFPAEGAEKIRRAAERGTVVYVCKTLSYIDYLYFSYAFLKYALPLSRFANGVKTLLMQPVGRILAGALRLWRERRTAPAAELARVVRQGESALLFLKRPHTLFGWEPAQFRGPYVEELIGIQRERGSAGRPIIFVPLTLVWGSPAVRAARSRRGIVDLDLRRARGAGARARHVHLLRRLQGLAGAGRGAARAAEVPGAGGGRDQRRDPGPAAALAARWADRVGGARRARAAAQDGTSHPGGGAAQPAARRRGQGDRARGEAFAGADREARAHRAARDRRRSQAVDVRLRAADHVVGVPQDLRRHRRRRRRAGEGAGGGAQGAAGDRALAQEPHRLSGPVLRVPGERPGAAAGGGRRQPQLLAARVLLSPRRRLLLAAHVQRRSALWRRVSRLRAQDAARVVQPRVLHRGRALAHRQDAGAQARAPRHGRRGRARRRRRPRAQGAGGADLRLVTKRSSKRRATPRSRPAARRRRRTSRGC